MIIFLLFPFFSSFLCAFLVSLEKETKKFRIKILRRFSRVFLHKAEKNPFFLLLHLKCHLNNFLSSCNSELRRRKNHINYENSAHLTTLLSVSLENIIAEASNFFFYPLLQTSSPSKSSILVFFLRKTNKNFSTEIDFHIIYDAFSKFLFFPKPFVGTEDRMKKVAL